MAGLTDDKAALIQMNKAMQLVTEQMGRLAVGAGNAGHAIQKDFTEQIAHFHWFASAIFDTMPFDGARRYGHGGGGGGRDFDTMESGVLRGGGGPGGRGERGGRGPGGFGRYPHFGPGTPPPPFYREPGAGPSQAYADRTTDSSFGGYLPYVLRQGHRASPPRPQLLGDVLRALGYKAPASQSLASATDDEFRAPRPRPIYGEEPRPPFRSAGRGRRGLSIRRYQPHDRSQGGAVVPYEPPYEAPPPRRYYAARVAGVPLLEHHPRGPLVPYGPRGGHLVPRSLGGGPLVESPWATEAAIPNAPYTRYGRPGGTVIDNDFNPLRRRLNEGLARFFSKLWPQMPALKLGTQIERLATGFKKLEEGLPPVAEFAHSTVKAGVMYGGLALQSGAPDAFATLTGSFKLLAATIGKDLLPEAVDLSTWLQKQAKDYEKLDEGTKKFYKTTALWTTIIAGGIAVLPRVIQLFHGLWAVLKAGYAAIPYAGRFAAAHPFLAAAGVGAGVGYAAATYGNSKASDFLEHWKRQREDVKGYDLSLTPAAIQETQQYKTSSFWFNREKNLPIAERQKYLQDFFFRPFRERQLHLQTEFDKEKEALYNDLGRPEDKKNMFSETMGNVKTLYNLTFNDDKLRGRLERMKELEKENLLLQNTKDYIVNPQGFNKEKSRQNAAYKTMQDQAKMQAYGLMLDFENRVQPAYFGIEDMGKKIQLEALGASPLQEEIRRIQIESRDALLRIAGYTKEQVDALNRGGRLP